MNRRLRLVGMILLVLACGQAFSAPAHANDKRPPGTKSGFITTPDGIKIHYLEAGHVRNYASAELGNPLPPGKVPTKGNIAVTDPYQLPTLLFIPGWTMPAWIWENQIEYFSKDYRVVAMDPRSQGESSKPAEGNYIASRARDIKAVVDQLNLAPVVLVGWSMAVTELASYVDQFGTAGIGAFVFVDGTAGEKLTLDNLTGAVEYLKSFQADRPKAASEFIRGMYKKPQSQEYLDKVTRASLATPTDTAVALALGIFTTDNREALKKFDKPVLIVAAKRADMAHFEEMQKLAPHAELEIFDGDGHALFVDDADKFNALLDDFVKDLR